MAGFVLRFDHSRLSVAFDVANAKFVGEDQVAAFYVPAPWLHQVHLSNSTRASWRHDRAAAGTVRFGDVLTELNDVTGLSVIQVISPDPMPDTKFYAGAAMFG